MCGDVEKLIKRRKTEDEQTVYYQARSQTFFGGGGQIGQILGPFMITCGLFCNRVGFGHFFFFFGGGGGADDPPDFRPGYGSDYAIMENKYDIISRGHMTTEYGGRDRMLKHLCQNYANSTTEVVELYNSYRLVCQKKRKHPRTTGVVNSLGQKHVFNVCVCSFSRN